MEIMRSIYTSEAHKGPCAFIAFIDSTTPVPVALPVAPNSSNPSLPTSTSTATTAIAHIPSSHKRAYVEFTQNTINQGDINNTAKSESNSTDSIVPVNKKSKADLINELNNELAYSTNTQSSANNNIDNYAKDKVQFSAVVDVAVIPNNEDINQLQYGHPEYSANSSNSNYTSPSENQSIVGNGSVISEQDFARKHYNDLNRQTEVMGSSYVHHMRYGYMYMCTYWYPLMVFISVLLVCVVNLYCF